MPDITYIHLFDPHQSPRSSCLCGNLGHPTTISWALESRDPPRIRIGSGSGTVLKVDVEELMLLESLEIGRSKARFCAGCLHELHCKERIPSLGYGVGRMLTRDLVYAWLETYSNEVGASAQTALEAAIGPDTRPRPRSALDEMKSEIDQQVIREAVGSATPPRKALVCDNCGSGKVRRTSRDRPGEVRCKSCEAVGQGKVGVSTERAESLPGLLQSELVQNLKDRVTGGDEVSYANMNKCVTCGERGEWVDTIGCTVCTVHAPVNLQRAVKVRSAGDIGPVWAGAIQNLQERVTEMEKREENLEARTTVQAYLATRVEKLETAALVQGALTQRMERLDTMVGDLRDLRKTVEALRERELVEGERGDRLEVTLLKTIYNSVLVEVRQSRNPMLAMVRETAAAESICRERFGEEITKAIFSKKEGPSG